MIVPVISTPAKAAMAATGEQESGSGCELADHGEDDGRETGC